MLLAAVARPRRRPEVPVRAACLMKSRRFMDGSLWCKERDSVCGEEIEAGNCVPVAGKVRGRTFGPGVVADGISDMGYGIWDMGYGRW
jgi:hypothetical protein